MQKKLKSKKAYFREKQYFTNSPVMWIFYAVFLVIVAILLFGMYQQLVLGKPWGVKSMSNSNLIYTFVFVVLFMGALVVLFSRVKLLVIIDSEGIHYRFPFFVLREKLILHDSISHWEIRKYRALLEYGGWGYRKGINIDLPIFRKTWGVAFIVKGNVGLQLYFTNGQKLLIGTQRPEAIKRAMDKLMKTKNEFSDD